MADFESRLEPVEVNLERLTGIVATLAEQVERLVTSMNDMAENQKFSDETIRGLLEARKQTDETVGTLMRIMDDWIRKNPRSDEISR